MDNFCIELDYVQYKNKLGFEDLVIVNTIDDQGEREELCQKGNLHHLKAYFRELGWSEYNNDKKDFIFYNSSTNTYDLSVLKFLEYEFEKLLVYIEDNNERIDIDASLIEDIHPHIANYLTTELSKKMSVDSKDLYTLANDAANFYSGKKNTSDLMHIPSEVIELSLAERFGWSLTDIENISIQKMEKILVTLNQQSQTQQLNNYNDYGNNEDVIDEKTGMRIIGGQNLSAEARDAIAHRIKK